jgi:hypothetical protein
MPSVLTLAPGMRILCRDAEWLVQRVEASNDAGTEYAVHVVGVDDLVPSLMRTRKFTFSTSSL